MTTWTYNVEDDPQATASTPGSSGKIEKVADHVQAALDRLVEQLKDKTNVRKLLEALAKPAQDLEDALWDLLTKRGVDTATGAQLKVIGKIVGQPYAGEAEESYRRHVRARIAANKSNGDIENLLKVLVLVIYDDAATIRLEQQYPAAVVARIEDVATTDAVAVVAAEFLRDAAAAGVRTILEYSLSAPAETFTFDVGPGLDQGKLAGAKE